MKEMKHGTGENICWDTSYVPFT